MIVGPKGVRKYDKCEEKPKSQPEMPSLPNGWAAYTVWSPGYAMSYYGAAWLVPQNPQKEDSQTLFYFSGFQNAYASEQVGTSIIQPVLQFGPSAAGGGEYWSIASWFVGAGHTVYSKLATVNVNDLILGNMTLTSGTTWSIVISDSANGQESSITADTGVTELYAFVTMEVYTITSCSDYPTGSLTFYDLVIDNTSGQQVVPVWEPETEPGCSESVTVDSPYQVTVNF